MLRTSALIVALALSYLSYAEEPAEEADLAVKVAKQSSRDVKLPKDLVKLIENEYREYLKKNKFPDQENLNRKLLNVSVELRQKRVAALPEDVRIATPLGGGVIDLSDFVTPVRGSFQMSMHASREDKTSVSDLNAFFISHAKARNIQDEQFGAGCGKYMDITSYFNKKMANAGFELYTADQRYASVLAGTFVLVSFTKEALEVGSVTFSDSRFPELMCENI